MTKLRPRDIFFNDPYFDYATCSKPGDLRLAKRGEVFGKWYKTPSLVTTLLSQERLTFSRHTGTDQEDALVLRIYERTADRLLINTYYTSKQNPEEIYAGTIHLERYDMAQTMESFSYMGIIDLLMLQTDSQILGLTDVFEDVQMAKHAAAHALGIYLMVICDQPWSDEAVTGGQETPAMMMGKEKEELQVVLPTDTLLHHIRLGMIDEVKQDIRGIYEPFRHKEYISLESAKMVTTELAITAFKGEVASQNESVSYLYYLNHIQQLTTLDEMEEDILQFATSIAEKRKKGGNHKKKIAEAALEYLKQNYMKVELNLNEVADYLNISVPYLAVLFKQETKQNFGAHLLEIRMEKAKELLRTTGDTIGEIAEKTGYSGAQYFAVCFKKYTGTSPGAYREQAKGISS